MNADASVDFRVRDVDPRLAVDLALTRIALGAWHAATARERRLAELVALVDRLKRCGVGSPILEKLVVVEDEIRDVADTPGSAIEQGAAALRRAHAALVEHYLGAVASMALEHAREGLGVLELIEAGNRALADAAETFEPSPADGRLAFEAYAFERVREALARAASVD